MQALPIVQGRWADEQDDDRGRIQPRLDRRRSIRRHVFKGANIHWRKWLTIHCVVRNLSEGGACLEVADLVPDSFVLVLDDVRRTCRVVWRHANRVGIEFLK
jgi:hypothetical protein